jgi:hypothetical protein
MRPQSLPKKEIRFAAKTGFLSKPIWEEFFATGSPRWRRRQWQLFLERDLFRMHPSRLPKDVLVLHRKHLAVKAVVGEAIAMPPFAPQIEHDETVARIVLSLKREAKVLACRFEAEMKREEWGEIRFTLGCDKAKYPDALIDVMERGTIVKAALEIELSRKSPKRYRQVLQAYAARKDVKYVLFVARAKTIFEGLKAAMRETYYPDWERPIGFCDLDAWLKCPGQAPIYFSERETTLERMASIGAVKPKVDDEF